VTEQRRKVIDASRVDLSGVTLATVVALAYRVPQDQVVAPDWTTQQRFDIQATLPPGSSKDQVPEMMQALLAERFKLAIHHDQKEEPVYALTVGKDGPKFHESVAGSADGPDCTGGVHKICHKTTMQDLVDMLVLPYRGRMGTGWAIDRFVLDQTGLKGTYDFAFDYGYSRPLEGPNTDVDLFTAFDAVRPLGLKLEPTKRVDDIVVIDHVERVPTGN